MSKPDVVPPSPRAERGPDEEARERLAPLRERVRRAVERSLNKVRDEELRLFLSEVVVERLDDVAASIPEEEREEFYQLVGDEQGMPAFQVSRHEGQFSIGGPAFLSDVFRRWGSEIGRNLFLELVRKEVLHSLNESRLDSGLGRFDVLQAYVAAQQKPVEHLENFLKDDRWVRFSYGESSEPKLGFGDTWEKMYEADPELFSDIMMVGARQTHRASMQQAFQYLPRSSWNDNFGARITLDLDGRPFRFGHQKSDVAVIEDRLRLWEARTGERPQTYDDLLARVRELESRHGEEAARAKKLGEQHTEVSGRVDSLEIELMKERRRADDLDAENKGLQVSLDAKDALLAEIRRAAEGGKGWTKSGAAVGKILELLQT